METDLTRSHFSRASESGLTNTHKSPILKLHKRLFASQNPSLRWTSNCWSLSRRPSVVRVPDSARAFGFSRLSAWSTNFHGAPFPHWTFICPIVSSQRPASCRPPSLCYLSVSFHVRTWDESKHLEKHTCSVSVPNSTFGLAVRPHLR